MSDAANRNHGVLLHVAYHGRGFAGYARQSNARSVEGVLEGAIRSIDPNASPTRGTSRTDAGVHALWQPVSFATEKDISPRGWVLALSQHLPEDVSIVRAARVPPAFDPRRSARSKLYRYAIFNSQVNDPLRADRSWRVGYRLNHQLIRDEAALLLGVHDFAAFRGAQDQRVTTVRQLFRVEVRKDRGDDRWLSVEVQGDRFLYNMVRIIVGTLVDVGRGQLQPGAISRAYATRERRDLGMTAPAHGLTLVHVELETEGEESWPSDPPYIDDVGPVA